jgi:hypothetical protein
VTFDGFDLELVFGYTELPLDLYQVAIKVIFALSTEYMEAI